MGENSMTELEEKYFNLAEKRRMEIELLIKHNKDLLFEHGVLTSERDEMKHEIKRFWESDKEARKLYFSNIHIKRIRQLKEKVEELTSIRDKLLSKNTWISVQFQAPEEFQKCAFVVSSKDEHYDGRVMGGTYQGFKYGYHEFTTPGIGWKGVYWMPLPEPPQL